MGRTYTDREKARALTMLDANEGNVYKTAKQAGIPDSTLASWHDGDRPISQQARDWWADEKVELADLYERVLRRTLHTMFSGGSMERANFQQLGIVAGILHDKRALLLGQPTSITENVSSMSADERAAHVLDVLARASQRMTSAPAGDTVDGQAVEVTKPADSLPASPQGDGKP